MCLNVAERWRRQELDEQVDEVVEREKVTLGEVYSIVVSAASVKEAFGYKLHFLTRMIKCSGSD